MVVHSKWSFKRSGHLHKFDCTGELGNDRLNGTRKIGLSYAKSVEYLICIGLGPSILSIICKNPSYSGPSYPSSLVSCYVTAHCCCPIYISSFIVNLSYFEMCSFLFQILYLMMTCELILAYHWSTYLYHHWNLSAWILI